MDYNLATHIMSFMGLGAGLTVVGIIALFKVADWLIGLKYKSKEECSKTRHEWSAKMQHDYASRESLENLKEDMHEIKTQNSKILNILMGNNED